MQPSKFVFVYLHAWSSHKDIYTSIIVVKAFHANYMLFTVYTWQWKELDNCTNKNYNFIANASIYTHV